MYVQGKSYCDYDTSSENKQAKGEDRRSKILILLKEQIIKDIFWKKVKALGFLRQSFL